MSMEELEKGSQAPQDGLLHENLHTGGKDLSEAEEIEALEKQAQEVPVEENKRNIADIPISHPAKIGSQEDLNLVIAQHQQWLESVLNPRRLIGPGRANFRGVNLSGYDLSGVNLSGATFINSILMDTDFTGSNLSNCDFSHAKAQNAKFMHARMKRVNFSHADLETCDFTEADLREVNWHEANRHEAPAHVAAAENTEAESISTNGSPNTETSGSDESCN